MKQPDPKNETADNEIIGPDSCDDPRDVVERPEVTSAATAEVKRDADPDQAWKALGLVNDWIKHADSKTGITLAATGASGILLYNLVRAQTDPSASLNVVAVLAGVGMLIAGLAGIVAVLPRLRIHPRRLLALRQPVEAEQDLSSLLFFSHIARKYRGDAPTYVDVLHTLTSDDDQLTRQIAQQVHANACVAHRKYRWTNVAVLALAFDYACVAVVAVLVGKN